MKILVLATNYPDNHGNVSLYYIHTRNKYYKSKGIDVNVVNFSSQENYLIDGIPVYTLEEFKKNHISDKIDILVCHSPNIRNHYLFLKKYEYLFKKIVFFFHGHEVLRCSKVYPKPYSYVKKECIINRTVKDCYDMFKLKVWRNNLVRLSKKSWFVFVSEWMYDEFIKWVKIDPKIIDDKKRIIYNSIGSEFEIENYDRSSNKVYDFITIRSFLDGSKYCIDVIHKIALNNPQYTFCIAGKGDYFKINKKPENIILIDKYLNHGEIKDLLNKSNYALLPTRTDSQGVMACEIATFGIPLITSDIDVCKEVFSEFENVAYIKNEDEKIYIDPIIKNLKYGINKNNKYFPDNTSGKEVELYKKILEVN